MKLKEETKPRKKEELTPKLKSVVEQYGKRKTSTKHKRLTILENFERRNKDKIK